MGKNKNSTNLVILFLFGLATLFSVSLIAYRHSIKTDLTAFMPGSSDPNQPLIFTELKQSVASRFWLIAIGGESPARLAGLSRLLSDKLREEKDIERVYDGNVLLDAKTENLLFKYRYLLDPKSAPDQFSVKALHESFQKLLSELQSPLAVISQEKMLLDPTNAEMRTISTVFGHAQSDNIRHDGAWFSRNGKFIYLVVEARTGLKSFRDRQAIYNKILRDFSTLKDKGAAQLHLGGAVYFATITEAKIRKEVTSLSVLATIFVIVLLGYVYRTPKVLLMMAIPVVGGLILAFAVTEWIFGGVHAISVAFGITLVGVALDYPVHVYSHGNPGERLPEVAKRIWPTLRLSVITTVIGFTALLVTAFPGIQQLGVFAVTGLVSAILITRYLLPILFPVVGTKFKSTIVRKRRWIEIGPGKLQIIFIVATLLMIVNIASRSQIWSDDLSALTPIPNSLKNADKKLHEEMNLPEPRYLIAVTGKNTEQVLQEQEKLRSWLDSGIQRKEIHSYQMAADMLPSRALQSQRQFELPNTTQLNSNILRAQVGTSFRANAFDDFVSSVQESKKLTPLTLADLNGGVLAARISGLVLKGDANVAGLVRLTGVENPTSLGQQIRDLGQPDIRFYDLKGYAEGIVGDYRKAVVDRSLLVFLLIILSIVIGIKDLKRSLRVISSVILSVLFSATTPLLLGQQLTIFHVISFLLVAGISVDYALFASRDRDDLNNTENTRRSLFVCAVSTIGVFGILSTSAIPVLQFIGGTVAAGTLAAYILSSIQVKASHREGNYA